MTVAHKDPNANAGARLPWIQVSLLFAIALALLLAGLLPALLDGTARINAAGLPDTLGNAAEVMAAVLAIAITVVAIVVELAATRYSHRVTELFLRARTNRAVLSLFAVTALLCLWNGGALLAPSAIGQWLALGLMSLCLLLLLPYFSYVLHFISPAAIVHRLSRNAMTALHHRDAPAPRQAARALFGQTVEDLHDVARKAIEQSDRSVALIATEALFALLADYRAARSGLPPAWFELDDTLRRDPDFVSMEGDALAPMTQHGLWLELKVFRQLTSLFGHGVHDLRDLSQVIAIRTREQLESAPASAEGFLPLGLQAFNSYLRTSINRRDPRTSYYLLNQYRKLADQLAQRQANGLVLEIAAHFRYYGQLAAGAQLPFLLEVAAYDLVHLIEQCRGREQAGADSGSDPSLTDALLAVLLELDQTISSDEDQPSLVGVRRAQLQLAAWFASLGDNARAEQIAEDLASEPDRRLRAIAQALYSETRPEYWELTERGINFSYLRPELHKHIEEMLTMTSRAREQKGQAPAR
jgi:hypothetical protein